MRHLMLLGLTVFSVTLTANARAQTYQWINEHGVAVYSKELPSQSAEIKDLAVVEGTGSLSALERRTLQIINEEAQVRRAETRPAMIDAGAPASMLRRDDAAERPNGTPPPNAATENTRDPCLLSWDPRCAEKHAGDHDPRWGYAPSILRSGIGAPAPDTATREPEAPGNTTNADRNMNPR